MKFFVLIGLPGSGKTHLAKQMNGNFVDDFKSFDELVDLKKDINIVASPFLCLKTSRDSLVHFLNKKYQNPEIYYCYFENKPDKCIKNIQIRNDGRAISESFIKYLSKNYEIPKGVKTIDVYEKPLN